MDLRNSPVTDAYRGFLLAFLSNCRHDDPALYEAASPICHLSKHTKPMLLIHGSDDEVVPSRQSIEMAIVAKKVGAPVETVILPGAGHTPEHPQLPVMKEAWESIHAFFARYLQGSI
jgi:dipeptidyl aminopeptidase/acylaminoacyl peptidase